MDIKITLGPFSRFHLLKCKTDVMQLLHKLSCDDYTSEVNCPEEA